MKNTTSAENTDDTQSVPRRNWRWVLLAGGIAVLSWLALGAGLLLDVNTGMMFALTTLAALATDGTVWLAALTLGVSTYQARRKIWQRLRQRIQQAG